MLEANLFRFTLSAAAENKKFVTTESFLNSRKHQCLSALGFKVRMMIQNIFKSTTKIVSKTIIHQTSRDRVCAGQSELFDANGTWIDPWSRLTHSSLSTMHCTTRLFYFLQCFCSFLLYDFLKSFETNHDRHSWKGDHASCIALWINGQIFASYRIRLSGLFKC